MATPAPWSSDTAAGPISACYRSMRCRIQVAARTTRTAQSRWSNPVPLDVLRLISRRGVADEGEVRAMALVMVADDDSRAVLARTR